MIFTEFKNTLTRHEIDTAQTITKGNLVSLDYTSNKLKAGISNGSNILGIAQESGIAGDFIYVATGGTAEGATNLVVGETCWSDSNGVLFPDSTAVANSAGYFVGICVSTSEVRIDMKTFTPIPVIDPGLLQNYIANPIAKETSDVTAWNVYDDSSAIPVDGIGGTTSITLSQNLINPISSTGDFKLTKGAFDLQGEGISYDFTIQPIHLAKIQQIEFNAKLFSGTYEKGDIRVYIIQDPNGTPKIIEPINVELELASIGNTIRYLGSFQTDYSQLNYRLVIHIASTSALAYIIHFNNFKVWEPSKNIGAIITDWTPYTPIFGGGVLSSSNLKYRRVGSNLELQGWINFSPDSSLFGIGLPNGLLSQINLNESFVGHGYKDEPNSSNIKSFVLHIPDNSPYYVRAGIGFTISDTFSPLGVATGAQIGGGTYTIKASIPIQGWESSIVMSSDSGTGRLVFAEYICTNNNSSSFVSPVNFDQKIQDSHSAVTTGIPTWKFTAPVSGLYCISGSYASTNVSSLLLLLKNGMSNVVLTTFLMSDFNSFSRNIYLLAGEYITINPDVSSVITSNGSYVCINLIQSNSQIGIEEKVYCRYETDSAQSYSDAIYTIVNFDTKIYDSHGAVTTGANWKFIAPKSGIYRISGICHFSVAQSALNYSCNISLRKNGIVFSQYQSIISQSEFEKGINVFNITSEINLLKGESIDLVIYTDYGGGALSPLAFQNCITISSL